MLNRVIKSTMKRVDNNSSSVDLLPSVKFNPALQKKMEKEKEGIKKINDYPETGCGLHLHVPRIS